MPRAGRKVFHVTYEDEVGGWIVRAEGGRRQGGPYSTKAEAMAEARRGVKSAALGRIVVHGRDGKVQTEHTYGRDPRRHRG